MEKKEYINRAEGVMLHVYNRFPVVFDHGNGMYLYDTDGKKYLDFGSGIGVMALGYNVAELNQTLKKHGVQVIEIPSSELSRGRGGSHCMTMALVREEV